MLSHRPRRTADAGCVQTFSTSSRRPAGAGRARHGRPPGPLSAPPPRAGQRPGRAETAQRTTGSAEEAGRARTANTRPTARRRRGVGQKRGPELGPVGSVGFTRPPGRPASDKARGPLVQIPGRITTKAHSTALTHVAGPGRSCGNSVHNAATDRRRGTQCRRFAGPHPGRNGDSCSVIRRSSHALRYRRARAGVRRGGEDPRAGNGDLLGKRSVVRHGVSPASCNWRLLCGKEPARGESGESRNSRSAFTALYTSVGSRCRRQRAGALLGSRPFSQAGYAALRSLKSIS
ncbi:hypothetical protein RKD30_007019 [Streptomyces pristinaespiralis]